MNRRTLLAGLAGTATASLAGCSLFEQEGPGGTRTVNPALEGTPTVTESVGWTVRVPGVQWFRRAGDRLTVIAGADEQARLLGLDVATGDEVWRHDLTQRPVLGVPRPDVVTAYEHEAGQLHVYEAADGTERWRADGAASYPIWWNSDLGVFAEFGDDPIQLTGRTTANGTARWERVVGRIEAQSENILLVRESESTQAPVEIGALDARTGDCRWTASLGFDTEPSAVADVVKETAVVLGADGTVVGLDLTDGRRRFRTHIDVPLTTSWSVVAERSLYLGYVPLSDDPDVDAGGLAKIDVADGAVSWSRTVTGPVTRPFRSTANRLYASRWETVDGPARLLAIDGATGETLWTHIATPLSFQAPRIVGRDDVLVALDQSGQRRWAAKPAVTDGLVRDQPPYSPRSRGVAVTEDATAVIGEGGLVSYDRESGDLRRRATTLGRVTVDRSRVIDATAYLRVGDRLHAIPV